MSNIQLSMICYTSVSRMRRFKSTGRVYGLPIFRDLLELHTCSELRFERARGLAIIIQEDATEYSLFKSVNCSTIFWWYFTRFQELITLYLRYLGLIKPVLPPVVNVVGRSRQVAVQV